MAGAARVGYSLPPYGKLEGAGVGDFIPPGRLSSSSSFSLGQALLGTEWSGIFQKVPFANWLLQA